MNANWMLKAPDESGRLAWASDSSPRSHAERGNERVTLSCWGREQLMEAAAFEDQPSEASLTCAHCGNTEREKRFELSLCAQCRDLLCRRPFPVWIKISCTIILAVCVFGRTAGTVRRSRRSLRTSCRALPRLHSCTGPAGDYSLARRTGDGSRPYPRSAGGT